MALGDLSFDSFSSGAQSLQKIGSAASGYANIIKGLARDKNEAIPSHIRDIYTNGFLPDTVSANGSAFVPKFFSRAFDEPTYLTFKIEFIFNDDRNMLYNNDDLYSTSLKSIYSNTMYDNMPEPFLEDRGRLDVKNNKSEEEETNGSRDMSEENDSSVDLSQFTKYEQLRSSTKYSTEWYLKSSLGDERRAAMLHTFKDALKDIQYVFPFYFKSVSGLQTLTNVDTQRGTRLKDAAITITCMEALDMRITQLLNTYRKIVWDDVYQRWVLPDMMRYFGMRIYVSEIRLFHDWKKAKKSEKDKISDYFGFKDGSENTKVVYGGRMNDSHYQAEKGLFEKIMNGVQKYSAMGSAVTNSFLGTKSYISQAMNYANTVTQTASSLYNGVMDILTDMYSCDNAINSVMPTICYECHMCEFDISSTMEHIDNLTSYNERKSPEPKIKIKIGQVKEYQDYPLNRHIRADKDETAYKYLGVNKNGSDAGVHLSDNLLAKRKKDFTKNYNIHPEVVDNITEINSIYVPEKENYNLYRTPVDKNDTVKSRAELRRRDYAYRPELTSVFNGVYQLTTAAMNEAIDDTRRYAGDNASNWVGSFSEATAPFTEWEKQEQNRIKSVGEQLNMSSNSAEVSKNDAIRRVREGSNDISGQLDKYADDVRASIEEAGVNKMNAIGEMMYAIADKIYNGGEIQSMAVSDEMKAKIAEDMFDGVLDNLENSRAVENQELKEFISSYRTIKEADQETKKFHSTATEKEVSPTFVKDFASSFEKFN